MKKVMLMGALIAFFASGNLYAATCTDSGTDGYNDDCDAQMRLDIPTFAILQFPGANANGSDLNVVWDGNTGGNSIDTINICVGTNSTTDVDVTATSANATAFNVTDGTTNVPYTLTLDGQDLTDGTADAVANANATDLTCSVSNIPLVLSFSNATLSTTSTDGTTPFLDTVTITVAPQ